MISRKIVIVEDDVWMRSFLEQLLAGSYQVEAFSDASTALEHLRTGGLTDLVTVDLRLPGMDGLEFVRSLRTEERFGRLPILMVSATDSSSDRIRCLREGADDFLVKPFNPEELLARIENLLRRLS